MKQMDEFERKHFLDTMRADAEFRAAVRRELLNDEVLGSSQAMNTLVDAAAQQRQDCTAMTAQLHKHMTRSFTRIDSDIRAIKDRCRP